MSYPLFCSLHPFYTIYEELTYVYCRCRLPDISPRDKNVPTSSRISRSSVHFLIIYL